MTNLKHILTLSLVGLFACGGPEFSMDDDPPAQSSAGSSTDHPVAGAAGHPIDTGGSGGSQAGSPPVAGGGTGGTLAGGAGQGGTSGAPPGGSGGAGQAGTAPGGASGAGQAGAGEGGAGTGGASGTGGAGQAGTGGAGSSGASGASGASGEAGQAGEAGTGGSGGAPECSGEVVGCFEEVPKVCIEGSWVQKGGACNWGCSSGACTCSNDSRFIAVGGSGPVLDLTTKLSWTKVVITTPLTLIETKAWCGNAYRLPTKEEVLSILAEQTPASLCQATQNMDASFYNDLAQNVGSPDFPTPASLFDVPVWTTDAEGGKAVTVRLNTGEVGSRDPNKATKGIAFCLTKVK